MQLDWGKILTSKAVWLGVLMIGAAIAEYIAGLPANTSIAQGISGVLTVVVRFLTKDSLLKS